MRPQKLTVSKAHSLQKGMEVEGLRISYTVGAENDARRRKPVIGEAREGRASIRLKREPGDLLVFIRILSETVNGNTTAGVVVLPFLFKYLFEEEI